MMQSKTFKGLLLGLSLLIAASAFASEKGSLQLYGPTSVAGNQLAAGNYNLKWDGNGPTVQLNILKGSRVVATIPAQLKSTDHASARDEAVVNLDGSGVRSLGEIRLSGKKYVLAVGQDAGTQSSNGGGSSPR